MERITGLLTHALPKNLAGSFEQLKELPFLILPTGETLFEYSLAQLQRVSSRVLICIDEAFVEDKQKYIRLASGFEVELVFLSELNGYASFREVSIRMERKDLVLSMQLGAVFPSSFSLPYILKKLDTSLNWGQVLVFGENYLDPKNNGELTLERNLKSLSFTDSREAGFVSSSGKLLRWYGLILMRNEAIWDFYQDEKELNMEYAQLLLGTSAYYDLDIPQACDLSKVLGTRIYSQTAFSLLTVDTRVYILLLEDDFQDFIEDMDPDFQADYNDMVQLRNS
jgi:hypothetical protein